MDLFKASVFSLLGVLLLFFLYPPLLLIYLGWGSLAAALSTGSFLQSLGLTVLISTAASLTAVILGIPAAYVLARYEFKLKELVDAAMDIPIVVPHTVVGLMVVLAFVAYGLGPSLNALGIKIVDALPGAVIAVSYLSATYAVRTVESAIRLLDPELENAARTLGAGPFRAFLSVVLPNIKRRDQRSGPILGQIGLGGRRPAGRGVLHRGGQYVHISSFYIHISSVYRPGPRRGGQILGGPRPFRARGIPRLPSRR
jgi:ABC-type sulfate transport system, permease component